MATLAGTDPGAVATAARALAAGEMVAFPTETVYGLGARADDAQAVSRVFALKGRPADHPLIVHVADSAAAHAFAEPVSLDAQRLMAAFWPGPLTLILPRRAGVAQAAAGGQSSIGLRSPAHPVAQALLRQAGALGVPGIAAPSANRFGRLSPTTAAHVVAEFGETLCVLDGGACELGIESSIVDLSRAQPALLRPGTLTRAQIERVLGQSLAAPRGDAPRAPGTLAAHYAPRATLCCLDSQALACALAGRAEGSDSLAVYSRTVDWQGAPAGRFRRMPGDATAAAQELYAALRELDASGAAQIWVETPPATPEWEGVRDRLRRAAAAG